MDRSANAEVMQRYARAWERGDWDGALAIWSDDVVHHVPGRSRLAGDFVGKQSFLEAYESVFRELAGRIEVVGFHDLLVGPDHAVALVTERAIRGERSLLFNRVVVYHLRGGQIVETWSHDYDLYAIDEFWAEDAASGASDRA
jgi:ketosteroid isomerase-like protein